MQFHLIKLCMFLLLSNVYVTPASAQQGPEKFGAWFPLLSANTFGPVSDQTCNETLRDYRNAFHHGTSSDQAATCAAQQRCIAGNLRADISARTASASVLLGLTPGLLASLGPTVAEISLLSIERPLLSFLLSFGSPAVSPSRVLKYESALDILEDKTPTPPFNMLRQSTLLQTIVSAAQYLIASAAVGNVVYTSYELGVRTTLTFRCVNSVFPLVWTLLPIFVHLPAALAFYIRDKKNKESVRRTGIWDRIGRETQLCLIRRPRGTSRLDPTYSAILLNYLATILGFIHVTFGMLIFSSLLFIETVDVLTVILRYFASTFICRVILMFELAGIRNANSSKGSSESSEMEDLEQTAYKAVPR